MRSAMNWEYGLEYRIYYRGFKRGYPPNILQPTISLVLPLQVHQRAADANRLVAEWTRTLLLVGATNVPGRSKAYSSSQHLDLHVPLCHALILSAVLRGLETVAVPTRRIPANSSAR